MKSLRLLTSAFALAALAACASYQPVPEAYTGPTATVRDTGFAEDGSKAQMFALVAIDGNRIPNAFGESASASYGRGAALTPVFPKRQVKATPMRVTLLASHATGAPIQALAGQLAGTFYSVEGQVEFTPEPNGQYAVKGQLRKDRSSVWIEDVATGQPVTVVITR